MIIQRETIRHVLATLAYRTHKTLRGADENLSSFQVGNGIRTPSELLRHMSSVIGYARTFFIGDIFQPDSIPAFSVEIERFHTIVADVSTHLSSGTDVREILLN